MGTIRNMTGMGGMDMRHGPAASTVPPPGRLSTSDGAALNGYDAYRVALRIDDDPLLAKVQLDNLESVQSSDGANGQLWDGRLWVGHNLDKLWIRSEGSRKFAPYIGYSWVRTFGTTADMPRTAASRYSIDRSCSGRGLDSALGSKGRATPVATPVNCDSPADLRQRDDFRWKVRCSSTSMKRSMNLILIKCEPRHRG